jgi:hypothetical protein
MELVSKPDSIVEIFEFAWSDRDFIDSAAGYHSLEGCYHFVCSKMSAPTRAPMEQSVMVTVLDAGPDFSHISLCSHSVGAFGFLTDTAYPHSDLGQGIRIAGGLGARQKTYAIDEQRTLPAIDFHDHVGAHGPPGIGGLHHWRVYGGG